MVCFFYRFGLKVPSIPLSSFEVSETPLKNSIATIAFLWNWAILNLRTLAKGDDWKNFIKVWIVTLILLLCMLHFKVVCPNVPRYSYNCCNIIFFKGCRSYCYSDIDVHLFHNVEQHRHYVVNNSIC